MGVTANSLKNKDYKRAYLLYGTESYLRRYYKNALKEALVNEGDNLNYSYFEGRGINPQEVVSMLQTMPFLAEHRVVLIENSGWFAKGSDDDSDSSGENLGGLEGFAEAVKNLSEDVVLIISEEKADKRSKLFKAINSVGICEEFPEQTEDSLVRWLINAAAASGKKMDNRTAFFIVDEVGTDMMLLENELSKLTAYCLLRDAITVADVEEVCTHRINNKIFDMIEAISMHRQKEALRLYDDLLSLRESPFHILALLVRQYTQMLSVKEGIDKNEPAKIIGDRLGMKDWVVKKLAEPARRMTREAIEACLEGCAATDEAIKNGNISDRMGVELLIIDFSERQR
jgi:DNA polymerase-3 subunit delta